MCNLSNISLDIINKGLYMNWFSKRLVILSLVLMSGCSTDPSSQDIKSPCAGYGEGADEPCIRHIPFQNLRYS